MFYNEIMQKRRDIIRLYENASIGAKELRDTNILLHRVKEDFYKQASDPTLRGLTYTYCFTADEATSICINKNLLYKLCCAENITLCEDSNNYYFNMNLPTFEPLIIKRK